MSFWFLHSTFVFFHFTFSKLRAEKTFKKFFQSEKSPRIGNVKNSNDISWHGSPVQTTDVLPRSGGLPLGRLVALKNRQETNEVFEFVKGLNDAVEEVPDRIKYQDIIVSHTRFECDFSLVSSVIFNSFRV